MPFTPSDPHINVARVLDGGQFADPLDWVAYQFNAETKVNRQELMESLTAGRFGVQSAKRAPAEALGEDRRTKFRMEFVGKCENRLVAVCGLSFPIGRFTAKSLEERAIDVVVLNSHDVLGVQATFGGVPTSEEGIVNENPLIRLLPYNVLNKQFFREKLELIAKDKKIKCFDIGGAVLITLLKPWLFYDVPASRKKSKTPQALLPF